MTSCWMCERKQYQYLELQTESAVERLVDEDNNCYVIVPWNSVVKHHVLVVLKKHKKGLIECEPWDLTLLGIMIAKWCRIFKSMGYDTVYSGCYSDNGHIHYHLYPIVFARDKKENGGAIQWLAQREAWADGRLVAAAGSGNIEEGVFEVKATVTDLLIAKEHFNAQG